MTAPTLTDRANALREELARIHKEQARAARMAFDALQVALSGVAALEYPDSPARAAARTAMPQVESAREAFDAACLRQFGRGDEE